MLFLYLSAQVSRVLMNRVARYSTASDRHGGSKIVPSMIGRHSEGPTAALLKLSFSPFVFWYSNSMAAGDFSLQRQCQTCLAIFPTHDALRTHLEVYRVSFI
jgi:hypothetical protein